MISHDGIIVLNKPGGMTSHDAVARVRRLCGVKRVGHTGTLDPMARGVLVICVGKATRLIELMDSNSSPDAKAYDCEMRLGVATDTYDTEGTPVFVWDGCDRGTSSCAPLPNEADTNISVKKKCIPTENEIKCILAAMVGDIHQTPPAYSAIKYKGKKLYELARLGEEIPEEALRPRDVHIESIDVTGIEYDADLPHGERDSGTEYSTVSLGFATVKFSVVCSKGTYIRSICRDAGEALGCGAAMSALIRTKSGVFTLADSVTVTELDEMESGISLRHMDEGIPFIPMVKVSESDEKRFVSGMGCDGELIEEEHTSPCHTPSPCHADNDEIPENNAEHKKSFVRVYGMHGFIGIGYIDVEDKREDKRGRFMRLAKVESIDNLMLKIKPYKVIHT